jgi:hypothetical protein
MTLSVRRILWYDYPSSIAWIFIVSIWLIGVVIPDYRPLMTQPGFMLFLIGWTLLWSLVLVWRIQRAFRLLRSGCVAPARVTEVYGGGWSRGPFTYAFAFEHDGRCVHACMHVARTSWRPALTHGQRVDVAYDPTHPSHAIILQLFQP